MDQSGTGAPKSLVSLVGILLEVTISDHDLNGILQMDGVLCSVPMTLVEPVVYVHVGLGRRLSGKMNSGRLEFCVGAFG